LTRSGYVTAISALVLLAAGWLLGYPELAVLGLGCVTALALALIRPLFAADLAVTRTIEPQRVDEGRDAQSCLTVTNRRHRRTPPIMAREVVARAQIPISLPSLRGGQSVSARRPLPTHRRGKHVIPPLTLGYSDPFRLILGTVSYGRKSVLWVHPRRHYMVALPSSGARDADGSASGPSTEGGIAFHSLREYQPGDDGRLIHWPSTARTERLMVKHNVVTDEVKHLIVLDTSTAAYSNEEAFEHAVRVTASWCTAAIREGCQLRMTTTDGRSAQSSSQGDLVTVLDVLAEVTVSDTDPGLTALASLTSADPALAVGVVTGRASAANLGLLPSIRSRVTSLTLARVGGGQPSTDAPLHGILSVSAATSDQLAAQWNELIQR
jgi:uncharacterized protein (DUF58 family)